MNTERDERPVPGEVAERPASSRRSGERSVGKGERSARKGERSAQEVERPSREEVQDRLRRRAVFLRELAENRELRRRVTPHRSRRARIHAALRRRTFRPR